MVDTAVILAAGMGTRLKSRTTYMPKGFLLIDGLSLIERSIKNLSDAGIGEIIIGTGHASEYYDELSKRFPGVTCMRSDLYASTGSMYTFYNMRHVLNAPLLLLESDLLYHPSGLEALMNHPSDDVILASGMTLSGDEVYIETDPGGMLINMSKNKNDLTSIDAELIGITKLSPPTFQNMFRYMESVYDEQPKLDYEQAMVAVSGREQPIYIHRIENFPWCEIDDEQHLNRAIQHVWPRINAVHI